jgi:hypothetical protein
MYFLPFFIFFKLFLCKIISFIFGLLGIYASFILFSILKIKLLAFIVHSLLVVPFKYISSSINKSSFHSKTKIVDNPFFLIGKDRTFAYSAQRNFFEL